MMKKEKICEKRAIITNTKKKGLQSREGIVDKIDVTGSPLDQITSLFTDLGLVTDLCLVVGDEEHNKNLAEHVEEEAAEQCGEDF